MPKYIYYISMLLGAILGIYAEAYRDSNWLLLMLAMVLLMFGLFGIAKTLSSKAQEKDDPNQNLNL